MSEANGAKVQAIKVVAMFGLVLVSWGIESHAQVASNQTSASDEIEEVVVTGTRILRRDNTSKSTIYTVGAADIQESGSLTMEDTLNELPQFQPADGEFNNNNAAARPGQATLNLRGLGTNRALVLLNGLRLQPSNADGTIDLNTIPEILVDRVETITGGASTAYGSDAISGVVNFILRRDISGLEVTGHYGTSAEGDAEGIKLSAAVGGSLGDDGRASLAFVYTDRGEVLQGSRPFFAGQGGNIFPPQGTIAWGNNIPSQDAVDAAFAQYGYDPGHVQAFEGLSFNNDGTLWNNRPGPSRPPIANLRNDNGLIQIVDNVGLDNPSHPEGGDNSSLSIPLTRYNAYGSVEYPIGNAVRATTGFNFAYYEATRLSSPPFLGGMGTAAFVPPTNPFTPDDLVPILASRADPDAPYQLNKRMFVTGLRGSDESYSLYQWWGGLDGDLPAGWVWEVVGSIGRTEHISRMFGTPQLSKIQALFDAPDGGLSICEGGYNPFGHFPLSQECQDYVQPPAKTTTQFGQEYVEINLTGPTFELPTGDVHLAVGGTHRRNDYGFRPDPTMEDPLDIVGFPTTVGASGKMDLTEFYIEASIPVAERVDLGLAYRYSDYSTAGGIDTYKADVDWAPTESTRLRASYNRAIRAPSLLELFSAPIGINSTIGPPVSGGQPATTGDPCDIRTAYRQPDHPDADEIRQLCIDQGVPEATVDNFTRGGGNSTSVLNSGNPDLFEETGDTFTFGLVWDSPFDSPLLSSLSGSIDYFDIGIDDAIGLYTIGTYLPRCFNLDGTNPSYSASHPDCVNVNRDPVSGDLNLSTQPLLNLASYQTTGVDLRVDWASDVADMGIGVPGRMEIKSIVSRLLSFEVQNFEGAETLDFVGVVNPAGLEGPLPEWKAVSRVRYLRERFDASIRWRYLSAMDDTSLVTTPGATTEGVDAYNYFDAVFGYTIYDGFRVTGGINNIADKEPPVVAEDPGNTQPASYDVIGRYYFVQFSADF